MIELSASIEIARPPSAVWEVLTDFEAYDEWNPYVSVLRGTPTEGSAIEFRISPEARHTRTETGKVTEAEIGERLRFDSVALYRFIYASNHTLELEALDGERTTTGVRTRAEYRGILAPLVAGEDLEEDLEAMNRALADRVEGRFP